MPLTIGAQNKYTISIDLGGSVYSQTNTISNLAFETTKHVVIEESTGQQCPNCPQGVLAIENLEKLYGEQVIPIAIHSSIIGTDQFAYENYNTYFGIIAQPMGLINRIDTLYAPMYVDGDGLYHFESPEGNNTFYDVAQREFETMQLQM